MTNRCGRLAMLLALAAGLLMSGANSAAAAGVPGPGDSVPRINSSTVAQPTAPSTGVRTTPVVPERDTSPVVRSPSDSAASGAPWWSLLVVGLAAFAAGGGGCYVFARRRSNTTTAPRAAVPQAPAARNQAGPDDDARSAGSDAESLRGLIGAVIAARDLLDPSSVLARRLGEALVAGGVSELNPMGDRFDPSRHHAVQALPTTDPDESGVIAEVQRVGYRDALSTIRPADVVVFRLEPAT